MYRSQGQDRAGLDAEPHDASPPTSDETGPVSASDEGDPFTPWSVNGNQKQPHCGSHAACRPEA